jgi:hypothetical protein
MRPFNLTALVSIMLRVSAHDAGSMKDSSPSQGTFVLPYIAEENADEDPEIKATVTGDSPAAQQLRELFLTRGKQVRMALPFNAFILSPSQLSIMRLCLPCQACHPGLHPFHTLCCLSSPMSA